MNRTARSHRRAGWLIAGLLFAAVIGLAGFAFNEWCVVRDRRVVLDWLLAQKDVDFWEAPWMTLHDPPPAFAALTDPADWQAIKVREGDNSCYPGVVRRRLFGDRDIAILSLGPTKRPDYCSCDRIKALFPETTIYSLRQDDRGSVNSD